MGRVSTEFVTMTAAREASPGTLPGTPDAFAVEFEEAGTFGAEIETVTRRPIGSGRSRKKGVPIDLNSAVDIGSDTTLGALERWLEAVYYAEFANEEFKLREASNAPPIPTATGFSIVGGTKVAAKTSGTVAGRTTLVLGKGYATPANNGVKPLTADITATTVTVAGTVAEATPPPEADLQVCGVRTTDVTVTVNTDGTGSLVSAAIITDWAALGFFPGMNFHIGGTDDSFVVTNAPTIDSGTRYGQARVETISGSTLTFSKGLDTLIPGTSGNNGGAETVDILLGRWVRDVRPTDDADDRRFAEITHSFEAGYPNLGPTPGAVEYEVPNGNQVNEFTLNLPLTDKSTYGLTFIGRTTPALSATAVLPNPVGVLRDGALDTGAALAAVSTSLVTAQADVCAKSVTITIRNNANPSKCLGFVGSKFVNAGAFEVDYDGQFVFVSKEMIDAVRDNRDVTSLFVMQNQDGSFAFDIPTHTVGGGGREFPRDEDVLINITAASHENPLGYNASVTLFPIVPLFAA